MISRVHGKIRRRQEDGQESWHLQDNGSMNGILVNGSPVDKTAGHSLQPGDIICFGRKIAVMPEFEYIFEAPHVAPPAPVVAAAAPVETGPGEEMLEQMRKIEELQKELERQKEQQRQERAELTKKKKSSSDLNVADLHSELACSICQDWLVHAATVECSHTFCWPCIDKWLLQKKFECPVCRNTIMREPVRTRAVEAIVMKTVEKLPQDQRDEYEQRKKAVEAAQERNRTLHQELEKSVSEAMSKGKAFFHISSNWKKREKETFQRGVKDYTGDTRETYCRLTGLTVQWVHSADDGKLNQALHNLHLPKFISKPPEEIRQRLLMFLRYG
jgi:hypothetical protein